MRAEAERPFYHLALTREATRRVDKPMIRVSSPIARLLKDWWQSPTFSNKKVLI